MILNIRKIRITNKDTTFFYAHNFPSFREPPLLNFTPKISCVHNLLAGPIFKQKLLTNTLLTFCIFINLLLCFNKHPAMWREIQNTSPGASNSSLITRWRIILHKLHNGSSKIEVIMIHIQFHKMYRHQSLRAQIASTNNS